MTDNEIIKALECWVNNFDGTVGQFTTLCASLNLIKLQKEEIEEKRETSFYLAQIVNGKDAEIEVLKKLHETAVAEREANVKGFTEELNAIKSKAIKEFAEMVCEGRVSNDPVVIAVRCAVKEMTEGKDAGKDI